MKTYKIHITQRILLNFEVEVYGENEEDAMRNFERENSEGNYWEEWADAHDNFSDILDEEIQIEEV